VIINLNRGSRIQNGARSQITEFITKRATSPAGPQAAGSSRRLPTAELITIQALSDLNPLIGKKKAPQKGQYRMLVFNRHESHINAEFNEYCKANKIIPLYLLSSSSHLTQLLDVGVSNLLKKAYGSQISFLIRASITHITKDDFFPALKAAFEVIFTEKNIKSSFQ
jgi:hypothetical protein